MKALWLVFLLLGSSLTAAPVQFELPDGDVVTLKKGTTWTRCVDMFLESYGTSSIATFNIDPTDAKLGGSTRTRRMAFLKESIFHQLNFKGAIQTRDRAAFDTIWTDTIEPLLAELEK